MKIHCTYSTCMYVCVCIHTRMYVCIDQVSFIHNWFGRKHSFWVNQIEITQPYLTFTYPSAPAVMSSPSSKNMASIVPYSMWCTQSYPTVCGAHNRTLQYVVHTIAPYSMWCIQSYPTVCGAYNCTLQYVVHTIAPYSMWCTQYLRCMEGYCLGTNDTCIK